MSEWQPIETAPKDGTPLKLTYFDNEGQGGEYVGAWNAEQVAWETNAILFRRGWFTHWMPLPAPPKTKSQPD